PRLLPDVLDLPAGERGERLRLALVTVGQRPAILLRGGTRISAAPVVAQDVTPLEVLPIASLLEDEVLREVRAVVAEMQPRDEDVAWPGGSRVGRTDVRRAAEAAQTRLGARTPTSR